MMSLSQDTRLMRGAPPGSRCSVCHQEEVFVQFIPVDYFPSGPSLRIGLCITCIGQLYQKTTEQGLPAITHTTPRPLELAPFSTIEGGRPRHPGA